jgi:hypothetical protein
MCLNAQTANLKVLQELKQKLGLAKDVSFSLPDESSTRLQLQVTLKAGKHKVSQRLCFELLLTNYEEALMEATSLEFLNELRKCLLKGLTCVENLYFSHIDDRLPQFINMVMEIAVKNQLRLKKFVLDSCGSETPGKILVQEKLLRELMLMVDEFHVDCEESDSVSANELNLYARILTRTSTLKVISMSNTFFPATTALADMLTSNQKLEEFELYNAFSCITKSALVPLIDAIKSHPNLRKLTFLQSKLNSALYKAAITTILDENKNLTGLCTDGYYSQNASWLGRMMASNKQLTEVNLSHPNFEDDYDRIYSHGGTLSLLGGITRSPSLVSIKLLGIPMNEEAALLMRELIITTKNLQKVSCGDASMMPHCFSCIIGGLLTNECIEKFTIQSLDLDKAGAQAMKDVLQQNSSLKVLCIGAERRRYSLRSGRFRQQQDPLELASLMAGGLESNSALKHLTIPREMKQDDCLNQFSRVLRDGNCTLERLLFWPKESCKDPTIQYHTLLNRHHSRSLFCDDLISQGLWAHILASHNADWVRCVVTEKPSLFDARQVTATIKRIHPEEPTTDTSTPLKRSKPELAP